jgi:hypothetical protein
MAAWLIFQATSLYSATNSTEEPIPMLRPPKGELPPAFWEEYGLITVVGGLLSLLLMAVVVWLLTRPKPVVAPLPRALAHRALESLRGKPEDGLVLSRVSRVLRHYFIGAFGLPPEQLTTAEFCVVLDAHPGVGAELASAAADFFHRCDERKFSPLPPPGALGAVDAALRLIETAESRFAAQSARDHATKAADDKPPAES